MNGKVLCFMFVSNAIFSTRQAQKSNWSRNKCLFFWVEYAVGIIAYSLINSQTVKTMYNFHVNREWVLYFFNSSFLHSSLLMSYWFWDSSLWEVSTFFIVRSFHLWLWVEAKGIIMKLLRQYQNEYLSR